MNIDRIAGTMTVGRPRADFPARVMAPIHGRPRPGFTARVMTGLDTEGARGRLGAGPRRWALFLLPAAIALVAGVMTLREARVALLPVPVAPRLATAPALSPAMEAPPRVAPASRAVQAGPAAPASRVALASRPADASATWPEPPPIYVIAALEGPADIAMTSIERPAFAIPALDIPTPLKLADLLGAPGGSPQNELEERP